MSTLRYAANAKNIINKPRVNEVRPWVLPKVPYVVTICLLFSTQNNEAFKYMGINLAIELELHSLPVLGISSDFMTDSFVWLWRGPSQAAQVKRWQRIKGRVRCCIGGLNSTAVPAIPFLFKARCSRWVTQIFSVCFFLICHPYTQSTFVKCEKHKLSIKDIVLKQMEVLDKNQH